jgi:hypothetical protein
MGASVAARAPAATPFPHVEPVADYAGRPLLAVVVDAEEEFEWAEPLAPQPRGTASIKAQRVAHTLFVHCGIRPTYLVAYPLASETAAIGVLREYLADGLYDIGAQLHPWVTPLFHQGETEAQSCPGNLPVAVEREKLTRLTDCLQGRAVWLWSEHRRAVGRSRVRDRHQPDPAHFLR